MPISQMKLQTVLLVLAAASLDIAKCGSTIIKVPPIKPGETDQTIVVNVPPTVDVTRTVQTGNNTSARLVIPPVQSQPPGGDCLLSDCDENDVGCDGLPPCGPYCPQEACSRVNCSQCWQGGFTGPCCWSCCSQYMPYSFPQQPPTAPQQRQQPPFSTFPQPVSFSQPDPVPIPYPQPQAFPIPQPQAIPLPQPQPFPIAQPQPIPVPQPQPFPFPQLQPIPVPQPQPIPIPQPRPVPFPVSVPQPYAVSQPIPYPQFQPQLQSQPRQTLQKQNVFMYPSPQCRQISYWPFLDCSQPPTTCGPWGYPGCLPPQSPWPKLCYNFVPC